MKHLGRSAVPRSKEKDLPFSLVEREKQVLRCAQDDACFVKFGRFTRLFKGASLQWMFLLGLLLCLGAAGCSASSQAGGSDKPAANGDTGASSGGAGKSKAGGEAKNTVEVTPEEQRNGGIRTEAVEPRQMPRTLLVPGQVAMDEQRTAHVSTYADGRVVDVLRMTGDRVERGTVLAHLHSHSVHETVGALAQDFANAARARAAVSYAEAKRDRYRHLYAIQAASLEQQQTSEQELVQAQTDLADAEAAVHMEREHLGDILQIEPESITPATLGSYENVPIESPIAGTVITRTVTPGMVLEPGNEAYMVSDLREVWMTAAVADADLGHLRVGQRVTVRSDAWPGEVFPGTVTLIGSALDPATRTVPVRATLPNPAGRLKAGMFVTAAIAERETRPALLVPEGAIQEVNGVQSVFVTADGTHFAPRALQTAPPIAGEAEVLNGLRPGERIATAGAFLLKSELLKSTIGDD